MKILTKKKDVRKHNDLVASFSVRITRTALSACDIEESLRKYVKEHEEAQELMEIVERVMDIKEDAMLALFHTKALIF